MKKALTVIVAVVVVAGAIVAGTRFRGPSGPKFTAPFTLDYQLDAKNAAFFTKSDDMATLLACTPFYAGAQPLPGQHTQEFDAARVRKVDGIIAESDRLAENALRLKSDVAELRKSLLDYLTICAQEEPKAETFAKEAGGEALRLYTQEALAEAEYKSLASKSDNPFSRSFLQYMKTAKAVELGALYLQDINNLVAFSALGLDGLSDTKNPKIAEANKKLDKAMGKFDGMRGRIGDVMAGLRKVNYGFKQLETGDYYFARAAVKFMRDALPELKTAAQNIKPNQYMDATVVAFTKDYLAKFDNFSAGFQQYLDSAPKSQLLPLASRPNSPGCAFAAGEANDYVAAYQSVAAPIKDPGKEKAGWLATGWNGIKTAVHGAQSVIGVGLDVVGTGVKNVSRIGAGIYYGNSAQDIWSDMTKNANQIRTNWKKNQSGSETLWTANQYMNALDDGAEYLASKGAQPIFGNGWTSWGIGKVSSATVGMFTGLAKGITLLGNRDADASDYAIGAIEVASSAIGGSKLVLKATQLPGFLKGLSKGTWISAQGAWNAASKLSLSLDKIQLDALLKSVLKDGVRSAGLEWRVAVYKGMLADIGYSNQALKAELANLIKSGMKAGWENFNGTFRQSLFDFTQKEFTNNLSAIATALGGSATGYLDNLGGQWAEDYIKSLVNQAMTEAPLAEELKGTWTGRTVFSSISLPKTDAAKSTQIMKEFKNLEGKALLTEIRFDGSPQGFGKAVFRYTQRPSKNISEGKAVTLHYTYRSGVVTIDQSLSGGKISLQGETKRTTQQGYAMGGPITTAGSGVTMRGKFTVTKPH